MSTTHHTTTEEEPMTTLFDRVLTDRRSGRRYKFTSTDIDRVEERLDNSLWVDPNRVNTRALAVHLLDVMTVDGHEPEDVSPLTFRAEHGLSALLAAIEEHTHTVAQDDDEDGVDAVEPLDVIDDKDGFAIVTDTGAYQRLSDEDALRLATNLMTMLQRRVRRPRELRRHIDQTTELGLAADYHA